jgi:nitrite reductase/ring-hydroxylating ferredoxin subunit
MNDDVGISRTPLFGHLVLWRKDYQIFQFPEPSTTMMLLFLFILATLFVSPNAIVVSFSTLPLQRPLGQTFKPLRVTWVSSYETPSTASKSFDSFDYMAHWYPVAWSRDVLLNKPTQVTVFDVNYVIAKIPEGKNGETIVAMEDRCPHKSAFLSEGRVTSTGYLQCAYHGWSFDGKDGTCVEIPQVVTKGGEKPMLTARACGTAVPAMIEHGVALSWGQSRKKHYRRLFLQLFQKWIWTLFPHVQL